MIYDGENFFFSFSLSDLYWLPSYMIENVLLHLGEYKSKIFASEKFYLKFHGFDSKHNKTLLTFEQVIAEKEKTETQ